MIGIIQYFRHNPIKMIGLTQVPIIDWKKIFIPINRLDFALFRSFFRLYWNIFYSNQKDWNSVNSDQRDSNKNYSNRKKLNPIVSHLRCNNGRDFIYLLLKKVRNKIKSNEIEKRSV